MSIFGANIKVDIYADDNYPPYSYSEGGITKGIYTEILMKAFSKMHGYDVNIIPMPWKRGLAYLEHGTGFAIYPPYRHTNERPYISPYSIPILNEQVVIYCKEEVLKEAKRVKWPEDFYGLTIGNNSGFSVGGKQFSQAVKEKKMTLLETKSTAQNILMLGLGRTDCYINDRLSIMLELKRLKQEGKYDEGGIHAKLVEGIIITNENGHLGFTNTDDGRFYFKKDFLEQFNHAINEMKEQGEIQKTVNDYVQQY